MIIPGIEARSEIAMACGTELPFGRYRGKTIARVGSSDIGLSYLRWMATLTLTRCGYAGFSAMLNVYLAEPTIVRRLEALGDDLKNGWVNP